MKDSPTPRAEAALPCPFCGKPATIARTHHPCNALYTVGCETEGCHANVNGPVWGWRPDQMPEQIDAWNQRHQIAELRELLGPAELCAIPESVRYRVSEIVFGEDRGDPAWWASCWGFAHDAGGNYGPTADYFRQQFWKSTRGWADVKRLLVLLAGWPECPDKIKAEALNVQEPCDA